MSRSNAPREQLLKPWHLALAVAGFIAAFIWVAPARQSLSLQDGSVEAGISELDIAYLKAERASDQLSNNDVLRAAIALIREQRVEEADALLSAHPDVKLSDTDKLTFSLERDFVALNSEKAKNEPDSMRVAQHLSALKAILNEVNQSADIERIDVLDRSRSLASMISEHAMAANFAQRLASLDKRNAAKWYRDCAVSAEFAGQTVQAIHCVTQQSALATTDAELFTARIDELRLNVTLGNESRSDELVDLLVNSDLASVQSLSTLSGQLLEIGYPLEASRVYAKLSAIDSNAEQSGEWLRMAARWAEAGGSPSESSVYLEMLRPSVETEDLPALDDEIARLLTASGDTTAMLERQTNKIKSGDTSLATLREGVRAAQGAGMAETAFEWNTLLVRNYPADVDGWIIQYDLNLGKGDLPNAFAAAKTLVDIQPNEAEHHVRLAKIAEWSGDPDLATLEWLWLSERYPSMETLTELTRLSTATIRPNLTAEALRKRSALKRPSEEELSQLITAYELEGLPNLAAKAIEDLLVRYGFDAQWMMMLAELHMRHENSTEALAIWERYESQLGQSVLSRLHRMETLWRNQLPIQAKDVANSVPELAAANPRAMDEATDEQVLLLSEIAWRYELPEIGELAETHLLRIDNESQQVVHRQRAINVAAEQGRIDDAVNAAELLRADTGTVNASMMHMRLLVEGLKEDSNRADFYKASIQPYLLVSRDNVELRQSPDYWILAAQYHMAVGEKSEAKNAYMQALERSPNNPDTLSAILWVHIGNDDHVSLKKYLAQYKALAEKSLVLWTPVAVAYNQLGMPKESIRWFERQLDNIDTDYGLLLTYADALEAASQSEKALKVRHYAINAIRPLLAQGASKDQDALLQQYAGMVARFGTVDQKERFTLGIIEASNQGLIEKDKFWQQEMAIAWLMATQRHDVARVVMAKLHEQRIKAPAWQALAVAMKQNDLDTVAQIVQLGQGISVGDNLLALRKLGRQNEAFSVAVNSLQAGLSGPGSEIAAQTYRALRQHRPGFAGVTVNNTVAPNIGTLESSFVARHTFSGSTFGLSLEATRRQFDSTRYLLSEADSLNDVALTLHYGDADFNTRLTAGYLADTAVDRMYFSGGLGAQFGRNNKHSYDIEFAMDEAPSASTILQLRGKQNRASAAADLSVGKMGFVRFSADVVDISTRVSERNVARGLSTLAEFGLRGTMGSHSWTSSVAASASRNNRVEGVPEELALNQQVTLSEIIADEAASLSLGASLSRGAIAGNYPQINSPRYFVNVRAGHRWPERNFGLQLDAGAGMRVIGGDELSVGFSHDGLVTDLADDGRSRLGVNYRYHF